MISFQLRIAGYIHHQWKDCNLAHAQNIASDLPQRPRRAMRGTACLFRDHRPPTDPVRRKFKNKPLRTLFCKCTKYPHTYAKKNGKTQRFSAPLTLKISIQSIVLYLFF